jgi:hypothetical protein
LVLWFWIVIDFLAALAAEAVVLVFKTAVPAVIKLLGCGPVMFGVYPFELIIILLNLAYPDLGKFVSL